MSKLEFLSLSRDASIIYNLEVENIKYNDSHYDIFFKNDSSIIKTKYVINSAGLYSHFLANKVLNKNKYDNITIRIGDGYKGWPEKAPFDRIMVTAATKKIPERLNEQLAPGGIMVIPVGETVMIQYLWSITKENDGSIIKEKIFPVRFVPMVKE